MKEYYVFQTQGAASACLNFINAESYFPISGTYRGATAPFDKQKTENWAAEPIAMTSGEWAVPRVPETQLDYVGVPVEDRQAFLANFGQDIRTLGGADLVLEARW